MRHSPPTACASLAPRKWSSCSLEERQHVVPAPAGEPELAPVVVVGGLAAHVDHGVDGGGAADHLAARIVEAAAVEPRLRLGLEHPVGARIADGEEIADRDVEPDPVVPAAGLEQQHARSGIGGEPVRQHAAGRAGADDDVVVFAFDRRCVDHAISSLFDRRPCGALGMPLPRTKQPGKDSGPSSAACTVIQARRPRVKPCPGTPQRARNAAAWEATRKIASA